MHFLTKPTRMTAAAMTILAAGTVAGPTAADDDLRPRSTVSKPDAYQVRPFDRDDVITVKFHDDLPIRLRAGSPSDLGSGVLDAAAREALALVDGGTWHASTTLDEATLDDLRADAQDRLGRTIMDFNTRLDLFLPKGIDVATAVDAFNALDVVEYAMPARQGPAAPLPPDYGPQLGGHNAEDLVALLQSWT